jgi:hypothetical protein
MDFRVKEDAGGATWIMKRVRDTISVVIFVMLGVFAAALGTSHRVDCGWLCFMLFLVVRDLPSGLRTRFHV